jgi:ribonuclease BN (tRNA processing enzyme)
VLSVRLTVLGGCGAWPAGGQACSGYLVEETAFSLLVDPGYGTLLRLTDYCAPSAVDAVFVTHGHPDHCADLNPLLRARVLDGDQDAPPLVVHALPGALDAVLALDRPGFLDGAFRFGPVEPGRPLQIGPLRADLVALPHSRPNVGVRLTAAEGGTLAYPGDTGATDEVVELARDADLLLADSSFVDDVPPDALGELGSAANAGLIARLAGVGHLVLAHLLPGTNPVAAVAAARRSYAGPIDVATPGLTIDLGT